MFYKVAWDIIKLERAFNALWSLDSRSFYLLNGALMVLLQKVRNPTRLKDFRPISLLHSFGNLFTKGLAMRLAPRLVDIVRSNQIAFVKERCTMTTSVQYSLLAGGCTASCRVYLAQGGHRQSVRHYRMALPAAGSATTHRVPTTMDGLDSFYALFGQHKDHCQWEDRKANLPRARTQVG